MRMDRNSIVVTGASGWVGREVCRFLLEEGERVVALLRRPEEGPWSASCLASLEDFETPSVELAATLSEAVAVIHCAAHVHRPLETAVERSSFHAVNAQGTHTVVRACREFGVERIVYVSSISGYDWGAVPATGAEEDGALSPGSVYAATKLQGEQAVQDSELDWRIVRLATVFGTGDKANFAKLAAAMAKGRFIVPGKGTARKSVIPVRLAARIIGRLAMLESVPHRLMNVGLPIAPTLAEICEAFSVVCGFRPARRVPVSVLRIGGRVGDVAASILGRFPLTTGTLRRLTTSTHVDTMRLREVFPGEVFPTFGEALSEAREYYCSFMAPRAGAGPDASDTPSVPPPASVKSVPIPAE